MDVTLASIVVRGLPLEVWITLPLVIVALYAIFRWRKYGEDSFTWNHSYFKRACGFGVAVWLLSYVSTLPAEPWQRALIWLTAAIIGVLALDYWGGEGIFPAATIALLMALVGVTAMPLPRVIGHFIYGDLQIPGNRPPKERTFRINLPPDWQELRGKSPHTSRSARGGAGLLQISLLPPLEGTVDGARVERELEAQLTALSRDVKLGKRLSLILESGKAGPIAFAKYQSEEHGTLAFWLIPTEVTVFATYTDGSPAAAEPDIREANDALMAGTFR